MLDGMDFEFNRVIVDITEMQKLADGLAKMGIGFDTRRLFGGIQIRTHDWDAVCHSYSYGGDVGLIEIMGTIVQDDEDSVEGYLTADEILARL